MERNTIFQLAGFGLLIAGIGIFLYMYTPDFSQTLTIVALLLILLGLFVGVGGVLSSVSKPGKGTIIK